MFLCMGRSTPKLLDINSYGFIDKHTTSLGTTLGWASFPDYLPYVPKSIQLNQVQIGY